MNRVSLKGLDEPAATGADAPVGLGAVPPL